GLSKCNWGMVTFKFQVMLWLSKFVGSVRTNVVRSLTCALTVWLPLPNNCGLTLSELFVPPATTIPLVSHCTFRLCVVGCNNVRLKTIGCPFETDRLVLAGEKLSTGRTR